ncbi:MAG: SRPBCC domain-containing protein [Scytolyngbya sp. HA4215-MV1]|nr:SRPBCC domain-containing protein [Scytolyngbya sp. HA4215-MV1]
MPSLYTEIEINAPRSLVWQVLLRKEQWKYWNTFLYDCSPTQPFQLGGEVFLAVRRVPADEEIEFQPAITLIQSEVCLKWVSSIPGFQNEHVFELMDVGTGRTRYVHQENFSGMLARFLLPFIRQDEQAGMRRMARELKTYLEKQDYPVKASKRR